MVRHMARHELLEGRYSNTFNRAFFAQDFKKILDGRHRQYYK